MSGGPCWWEEAPMADVDYRRAKEAARPAWRERERRRARPLALACSVLSATGWFAWGFFIGANGDPKWLGAIFGPALVFTVGAAVSWHMAGQVAANRKRTQP